MRKYIKQISYVMILILFVFGVNITVFAAGFSKIDFTKKGSVSITLLEKDTKEPVSQVAFALYHVGDIKRSGNSLTFMYNKQFKDNGMALENLREEGLSDHLADYAVKQQISSDIKKTDTQGKAVWNNLDLGLYLVVQAESIQGEYTTKPFLVSVPICESNDDEWTYHIDASPKIGALPDEKPEEPPTPPLIQTGQLNWPIPVLAGVGVVIFAIGWAMTFMKRKK